MVERPLIRMNHRKDLRNILQHIWKKNYGHSSRLRQAWLEARRELVAVESDPEVKLALLHKDWAFDPGEDPYMFKYEPRRLGVAVFFLTALCGFLSFWLGAAPWLSVFLAALGGALGLWGLDFLGKKALSLGLIGGSVTLTGIILRRKKAQRLGTGMTLLGLIGYFFGKPRKIFDFDLAKARLEWALSAELQAIEKVQKRQKIEAHGYDQLLPYIVNLSRSDPHDRPQALEALLDHLKRSGVELGEAKPRELVWNEQTHELYHLFGLADEGDKVVEESPPILIDGKLKTKGLVRRLS